MYVKVEAIIGKNEEAIMNFEKVICSYSLLCWYICLWFPICWFTCVYWTYNYIDNMVIAGPINWSIHHNIYGWVCNASKAKVWLFKAEQVSAWFIEYWSIKTRGFCSFICFMGKERWEKSIIIRWAGWYFYLMHVGLINFTII